MIFIYKLISPSKKIYIGKTKNLATRWRDYSRYDCVEQRKLYKALLKYGWTAFTKEVIEECDVSIWKERESYWIQHYNSIKLGYNIAGGGEGGPLRLGQKNSEEHKRKCSEALRGRHRSMEYCTDEYRAKLSRALKGRKGFSPSSEIREKISNTLKGRPCPHTKEQDQRIADALRGRTFSDTHRRNISLAKKGVPTKKHSEKTKEKMRQLALVREQKKREARLILPVV